MLPISEKVNVLNLIRKKCCMYWLLRSTVRMNPLSMILKKQQETRASFAVPSQTAKAVTTMQDGKGIKFVHRLSGREIICTLLLLQHIIITVLFYYWLLLFLSYCA